jgi:quercetin dioxygenase-like cupin family protein
MGKLTLVAIAFAAFGLAGTAQAATAITPAPAAEGRADGKMRMSVSQLTLAAGERLPDHQPAYLRYIYVVSGRLQVSNLVTGGAQEIAAGEMAVETAGEMHSAKALGDEPAEVMIVEQAEGN